MTKAAYIATIVILAITHHHSLAQSCTAHKFVKTEGLELANHVIKTIIRTFLELCWDECAWLPWCFSTNARAMHDGSSFECDLNNSTKMDASSLVQRTGSDYYEMTDFNTQTNCKSCQKLIKQVLQNGWYRLNTMLYKFFSTKMNWTEAVNHCRSIGGNLVTIKDSYLDNFIYNLIDKDAITRPEMNISDGVHFKLDGTENDVNLRSDEYPDTKARYETVDGQTVLHLTGKYSYADIPVSKPFNGIKYTVMVSVKIHPNQSDPIGKPVIFSDSQGDEAKTFRIAYIQTEYDGTTAEYIKISVFRNNVTVNRFLTPRYSFPKNVWNHLAVTLKSTNNDTQFEIRVFINGTESLSEVKMSEPPLPVPRPYYQLGVASNTWKQNNFNLKGDVKDLMMFNRTLNSDEINGIIGRLIGGAWIGFSSLTSTSKMGWSDGSHNGPYVPLPVYDANAVFNSPSCVAIPISGKWISRKCEEKMPFVCQKPVG